MSHIEILIIACIVVFLAYSVYRLRRLRTSEAEREKARNYAVAGAIMALAFVLYWAVRLLAASL